MKICQEYLRPNSIPEALQALSDSPGAASLIAGGTDLILELQQGLHPPVHTLVDITGIPEMIILEIHGEELYIGAAVPLNRIASSSIVNGHALALLEACSLIGGPQVRNVATLGGNVAHALPAADGTIALMALNAQALVADAQGYRRIPLSQLFLGPGKSSLRSGKELLVGFYIPVCQSHQASAFKRIMRAQGIALPILNVAVWLERHTNHVTQVRIAVGPSGPTPQRIHPAEDALIGQPLNPGTCSKALTALLDQVHFRTSPQRATADYRRHIVSGLLSSTLETAWQRAA